MDTIYSNKKYAQSLTAGSDFYRSSPVRPVTNDYTSWQNTMGRRSTISPPYTYMSKYSYGTDVSGGGGGGGGGGHYGGGYNSWGFWGRNSNGGLGLLPDHRNLSPSASYQKKQKNIKSFSIILMIAAFIVVLAVLSVAGLAFYFSTMKSDVDDSILVFDGNFRVAKGDVFTTGMRYNQTSAYKQKAQYYEKLIKSAFESHNLILSKCLIMGFGEGPLVNVFFRVFLDMRHIPITINNVEHHISQALIDEVSSAKSTYKHIKIDPDAIEIKRLLDKEVLRNAPFVNEMAFDSLTPPPMEDRRLITSSTKTPKILFPLKVKPTVSKNFINESYVDMENLPVIQGSFEVTKTDADIAQRKSDAATLKPVSAASAVKIKDSGAKHHTAMIEKVTTKMPPVRSSTPGRPVTTVTIPTSTSIPYTTTASPPITTTITETIETSSIDAISNVPVLNSHLFTSPPVLDNEPWRPINPIVNLPGMNQPPIEESSSITPLKPETIAYRNRFLEDPIEAFTDPPLHQSGLLYQSFTNPGFSPSNYAFETLGSMDLKPVPIPVNKLFSDETESNTDTNLSSGIDETEKVTTATDAIDEVSELSTPFAAHIGELLFDLLEIRDDTSRHPKPDEKPETVELTTIPSVTTMISSVTSIRLLQPEIRTSTPENVEVDTVPTTTAHPSKSTTRTAATSTTEKTSTKVGLFPMQSNWEFVNGTLIVPKDSMKKVFNETLQALVVENIQSQKIDNDHNMQRQNTGNIQNISTIFDTLATKLGITADVPSKTPPYALFAQNKLKQKPARHSATKLVSTVMPTTTTTTTAPTTSTTTMATTTLTPRTPIKPKTTRPKTTTTTTTATTSTTTPSTRPLIITKDDNISSSDEETEIPLLLTPPIDSMSSSESSIHSTGIGQAEVEVVDPTLLEEMLSSSSSSTTRSPPPSLVTLLPVKSNSGIRNFRKPANIKLNKQRGFDAGIREAIVKSIVQFDA